MIKIYIDNEEYELYQGKEVFEQLCEITGHEAEEIALSDEQGNHYKATIYRDLKKVFL